jgi:hypothetical protein
VAQIIQAFGTECSAGRIQGDETSAHGAFAPFGQADRDFRRDRDGIRYGMAVLLPTRYGKLINTLVMIRSVSSVF